MLVLTEMIYSPDRASPENNWTNENYTRLTGACSAGDWSFSVERRTSEYNRAEAEAGVALEFEKHKPNCLGDVVRSLPSKGQKRVKTSWWARFLRGRRNE